MLYGRGDPHPIWHQMREREPVRWHACSNGLGFWSVTTFPEVHRVLWDAGAFTSERGTLLHLLGTDDPAGGHQMAVTDPPRHARMREPLQRALAIRSVERRTGLIAHHVRRLIAGWLISGGLVDTGTLTLLKGRIADAQHLGQWQTRFHLARQPPDGESRVWLSTRRRSSPSIGCVF